jgi:hypothetical protein
LSLSFFAERFAAASNSSPVLRRANPAKLALLLMHTSAQLTGGRAMTREEVAAIPLETLEGAVSAAMRDFPSWERPKPPPVRVSPAQRLEDVNAEAALLEARKAEHRRGEQPALPPGAKRAALLALPADLRLAAMNGDRQFAHLIDPKK